MVALGWLAAVFVLTRGVRLHRPMRALTGGVCALVLVLVFGPGADALIFRPLGTPITSKMSQAAVNRETKVLLGLWRGMLSELSYQSTATGRSQAEMEELLKEAQTLAGESDTPAVEEPPNLILILSESFFDVTTLPQVSFGQDPLAGFHALQQEGISGTFMTRSLGYGTCNIELEILTGLNTGLLWGEDLYNMEPEVFSRLPAVPALLQQAGYYTGAVHTYSDDIYNRAPIFRELGFAETYFEDDFAAIDPHAPQEEEAYQTYLEGKRAGTFLSDEYLTDLLIDLYEQKKEDGPVFLYGMSMENHAPYGADKYADEELTVDMTSPLTGEGAEMLQSVCQGTADASQALQTLTDYFARQDEPTVVVFFGDHRPGMGLATGGTVYSQLGMCGTDYSRWSQEEMLELYSTSYLIWSNDPRYLPGQPGEEVTRGTNYLGVDLLNLAGVVKPIYWGVLQALSHTRINDTWVYTLGQDGAYTPTLGTIPSQDDRSALKLLSALLEDTLYGEGYVTAELAKPPN